MFQESTAYFLLTANIWTATSWEGASVSCGQGEGGPKALISLLTS